MGSGSGAPLPWGAFLVVSSSSMGSPLSTRFPSREAKGYEFAGTAHPWGFRPALFGGLLGWETPKPGSIQPTVLLDLLSMEDRLDVWVSASENQTSPGTFLGAS